MAQNDPLQLNSHSIVIPLLCLNKTIHLFGCSSIRYIQTSIGLKNAGFFLCLYLIVFVKLFTPPEKLLIYQYTACHDSSITKARIGR